MLRWLLACSLLSGCHIIFALDDRPDASITPGDAGDGGVVDAPIDAGPCVPVGHDEDNDGIDDACDNCPTIRNSNQLDSESTPDGVGDVCDPDPNTALDRILYFSPFLESGDFTVTGGTIGGDVATIPANGAVETITTFQMITKIEIEFEYTGAGGAASHLDLDITGGARCRLRASDCNGNGNTSSCLLLFVGAGTATFDWTISALFATHLTLDVASTCQAHVGISYSPSVASLPATRAGKVRIGAGLAGAANVKSLIVYGTKQ